MAPGELVQREQRLERGDAASGDERPVGVAVACQTSSGSIAIAPAGHSCTQIPQPLQ